ncbi:DUF3617 domain-containing protein [Croceicoccus bisphenolivorans]|uniref:DUF3617 domain-containing protein n=1 Tax=Croceicoccus bisphenolivorans TaxID=1783232 RepID=UPI000B0639C1|nr:DUF3617 domain-containing protein [Croceicoccus bisphenolivorans]
MTMRTATRLVVIGTATLALAACGSDNTPETGDDASAGGMSEQAIAAEMKQAVRPQPGEYSSTMKLVELDVPGLPEAQVSQMRSMMEGAMGKTQTYCLTKEEADKGFEEMAKQTQDNCKIESFDANRGNFTGKMSCADENSSGTMTMSGTGTETGSDMTMAMDMTAQGLPGGKMAMTLNVVSKRVGDCKE